MEEKQQLARIRWACRRGMLELDMILLPFFDDVYPTLEQQYKQWFQKLLECTDPEIFAWLMGHEVPEEEELKAIVTRIRQHFQTMA